MKILKKILTTIFWLVIIMLLVAPIALIYQISNEEITEYTVPETPVLQQVAIGKVVQSQKADVAEYITVTGTFISSGYAYMELDYESPDDIRWLVRVGDEIQEGQAIGIYAGEEVLSSVTGILVEMKAYGQDAYLRFELFSPLELECRVVDRVLSVLKRSENLKTENGAEVKLIYSSSKKNSDGTTTVRLSVDTDEYWFGQEVRNLKVLTGRVYRDAVVLPVACVYQKVPGENNPWYVRQVTESGMLIGEYQVEIGYSNGETICVTGISAGNYYDSGYKVVVGG